MIRTGLGLAGVRVGIDAEQGKVEVAIFDGIAQLSDDPRRRLHSEFKDVIVRSLRLLAIGTDLVGRAGGARRKIDGQRVGQRDRLGGLVVGLQHASDRNRRAAGSVVTLTAPHARAGIDLAQGAARYRRRRSTSSWPRTAGKRRLCRIFRGAAILL